MDSNPLVTAQNLSAWWNKEQVVRDCTLSVSAGEVVCLCGPNGSGKSTLLTALAGIELSTLSVKGQVQIMGADIQSVPKKQLACMRSYLLQHEEHAWNYTVRDTVLMGRFCHTKLDSAYSEHDFMVTDDILKRVQIDHLAERSIFSLSGGEAQKVRIARSLAQEPSVLLLDEPLAGLDFSYQEELMHLLQTLAHEEQKAVLVSVHDLNTAARFADRIILLPKLEPCFSGTVSEQMGTDALERTYGYRFGSFEHPVYHCPQVYTISP